MAKGSIVKTLLAGVAGGAIALSGGAAYQAIQGNSLTNTSLNNSGTTKVSTTAVKVSSDTTAAISKVSEAVVSVLNYQPQQASSDVYGSIFGNSNSNSNSTPQLAGEGTGVIYKKNDGKAYLVTNDHVVSGATELKVRLSNGRTVDAKLVGTQVAKDLAVLEINSQYVTQTATFADSSQLTVGEPAIAIGSPLGTAFANSVTQGIVSGLNRTVQYQPAGNTGAYANINAIQTDASINPGNSGGALINIKGQVIGINSSKLLTTENGKSTVEGMGFAIPSDDVVKVINMIETGQKMPAIGISMADLTQLTSSQLSQLKLPNDVFNGVYVNSAQSGLPAANAGLTTGDVIVKLGNTAVSSGAQLQSLLLAFKVGDTTTITYYRAGTAHTVNIHLTADSSQLTQNNSNSNSSN